MSDAPDNPTPPPPGDAPPPPPAAPPPPPSDAPPPPPGNAPPPPPAAAGPPPAGGKSDNTAMLALAYLWVLCLVPFLVEKDDAEVQWHAKHGLVWLIAEIIVWVGIGVLFMVPVVGCFAGIVIFILPPASLVIRIIAIVKATKGERFLIPGLSQYADKL